MTNLTATRRFRTPRPGSVGLRLVALAIATCVLSLTALTGSAGAHSGRAAGTRRHGATHRRAHKHAKRIHAKRTHAKREHTHAKREHTVRTHHKLASGAPSQTQIVGHPACADEHTRISRASRTEIRDAVLCLLDIQRRNHGLPGLRGSARLNRSAQLWTNDMVGHRDFSHGADFAARISAVGFDWSHVGENIATGFRTPAGVVRAWMASTGHCQNILNPEFREIGVGVDLGEAMAHDRGTWTTDFGLRMRQRADSGNWAAAEGCPYR